MTEQEFKVGDRVILNVREGAWHSHDKWGRVGRITSGNSIEVEFIGDVNRSVLVRCTRDGRYRDLRHPSAIEVAERAWLSSRPRADHVHLSVADITPRFSIDRRDASVDVLRTIASELLALASWLESKPKAD